LLSEPLKLANVSQAEQVITNKNIEAKIKYKFPFFKIGVLLK